MSVVQLITGQFKIVNLVNDANLTFPSNATSRSVNFVQIKPILMVSSSTSAEPPTKSTNDTARALQQEMVANKFIKLSIVNSTTTGNKTRDRKIQQTMRTNARQNELPAGDWSKTADRPLTNIGKFATVVGYAKRSKIRSTSRTDEPENSITPVAAESSGSKVRRHKYRNFKSRCRCERIWNCARLQISVARCAPDYFMCCF
uniref:Uncharacterized protein n=1 Tax=Anopheles maculatus TaxID=74869 RepID=A0A182SKC9_9DIPT